MTNKEARRILIQNTETSRDCISIEPIQWYSQNKDGYLVKGAYSKEEAYVKLTDVYENIRTSEDCRNCKDYERR